MIHPKLPKIFYGGDYNPEQWPRDIWDEDMRMFKLAGIDIATVNVFSWARLQPDEATYDFSTLDDIMDMLADNGIYACLATSTAAVPPGWRNGIRMCSGLTLKDGKESSGGATTSARTARHSGIFPEKSPCAGGTLQGPSRLAGVAREQRIRRALLL